MATIATPTRKPGPRTRARRWASGFRERETWAAYGFLIPWFVGFIVFTSGPMIASAYLSFTNYSVVNKFSGTPTTSVGFDNYRELVDDPKVAIALKNTFIYTIMAVPGTMIFALVLALILSRINNRTAGFFRTLFYLPQVTPPVAVGILFLLLFNGSVGLINRGLELVGISGPFWTTDPPWVKPGLALMEVWAVGGTMVIYLAAIKSVPQHLYEAAAIDGASAWRRFRNITLPMISPSLFFTFIILTIAGFTTFTQSYTAFFGAGTKSNQTEAALFYSIYLFQEAFQFFRMGYASALAWLLFVIIMVITLVQVKVSNRFVFYQGERK